MSKEKLIETLKLLKISSKDSVANYITPKIHNSLRKKRIYKIEPYKLELLAMLYEHVRNMHGVEEFETCRKILIVGCLLNNWNDIFSEKYPMCIQDQFDKYSNRILKMCQSDEGWGIYKEEVYWKDLAIARQQIYPAGAGIVEAYSGFGFRQGLSVNVFQSVRFLKLLYDLGGRRGFYQIHTHTPLLSDFNEQGWRDCYIRIAEMMIKHEEIKGVFRCSWFCDPELINISPKLTYLQRTPVDNGAELFYVGEDRTGNAFAKSKTRVRLYNEGKYQPKTYLLVWPRRELIKWAKIIKGD